MLIGAVNYCLAPSSQTATISTYSWHSSNSFGKLPWPLEISRSRLTNSLLKSINVIMLLARPIAAMASAIILGRLKARLFAGGDVLNDAHIIIQFAFMLPYFVVN